MNTLDGLHMHLDAHFTLTAPPVKYLSSSVRRCRHQYCFRKCDMEEKITYDFDTVISIGTQAEKYDARSNIMGL